MADGGEQRRFDTKIQEMNQQEMIEKFVYFFSFSCIIQTCVSFYMFF